MGKSVRVVIWLLSTMRSLSNTSHFYEVIKHLYGGRSSVRLRRIDIRRIRFRSVIDNIYNL